MYVADVQGHGYMPRFGNPINLYTSVLQMDEGNTSGGGAPPANAVKIYTRDNGSGKTELVARFNTGAIQQIAIQP